MNEMRSGPWRAIAQGLLTKRAPLGPLYANANALSQSLAAAFASQYSSWNLDSTPPKICAFFAFDFDFLPFLFRFYCPSGDFRPPARKLARQTGR